MAVMKRLLALMVCASSACSAGPTRDWATAPAIVERDTVSPLYAVSDIHGGYQRVVALLHAGQFVLGSDPRGGMGSTKDGYVVITWTPAVLGGRMPCWRTIRWPSGERMKSRKALAAGVNPFCL